MISKPGTSIAILILVTFTSFIGDTDSIRMPKSNLPQYELIVGADNWIALIGEDNNIWFIHPDGSGETQVTHNGSDSLYYRNLKWSPDGGQLAAVKFEKRDGEWRVSLIIMKIEAMEWEIILDQFGGNYDWAPDGKHIVYDLPRYSDWPNSYEWDCFGGLEVIDVNSKIISESIKPLTNSPLVSPIWTPDDYIVFQEEILSSMIRYSPGIYDLDTGEVNRINIIGSDMAESPNSPTIVITPVDEFNCYEYSQICEGFAGRYATILFDLNSLEPIETLPTRSESCDIEPKWSPDGNYLAVANGCCIGNNQETCPEISVDLINLQDQTRSEFVKGMLLDWSPDSEWLLIKESQYFSSEIHGVNLSDGRKIFLKVGSEAVWQPVIKPDLDDLIEEKTSIINRLETTEYMATDRFIPGEEIVVPIKAYDESSSKELLIWVQGSLQDGSLEDYSINAFPRVVLQEKALASTLEDYSVLSNDQADIIIDLSILTAGMMILTKDIVTGPGSLTFRVYKDSTEFWLKRILGSIEDLENREKIRGSIEYVFNMIYLAEGDIEAFIEVGADIPIRVDTAKINIKKLVDVVQPSIEQGVLSVYPDQANSWVVEGSEESANIQMQQIMDISKLQREYAHDAMQEHFKQGMELNEDFMEIADLFAIVGGKAHPLAAIPSYALRLFELSIDLFANSEISKSMDCLIYLSSRVGDLAYNPGQMLPTCEDQTSNLGQLSDLVALTHVDKESWVAAMPQFQNNLERFETVLQRLEEKMDEDDQQIDQQMIDEVATSYIDLDADLDIFTDLLMPPAGEIWTPETALLIDDILIMESNFFGVALGLDTFQQGLDITDLNLDKVVAGTLESLGKLKADLNLSNHFSDRPIGIPTLIGLPTTIEAKQGESVTLQIEIKNIGYGEVTQAQVTFLLGEAEISAFDIEDLASGETEEISFFHNFQGTGSHLLFVELKNQNYTGLWLITVEVLAADTNQEVLTVNETDEKSNQMRQILIGIGLVSIGIVVIAALIVIALTKVKRSPK